MKVHFFTIIAIFLGVIYNSNAFACSYALGFVVPEIAPTLPLSSQSPPKITLKSIERGTSSDAWGSCDDYAVIKLEFKTPPDPNRQYVIEVAEGFSPFYIPNSNVMPKELSDRKWGFFFAWPDIGQIPVGSEPINFTMKIAEVSAGQIVGQYQTIKVSHPGENAS